MARRHARPSPTGRRRRGAVVATAAGLLAVLGTGALLVAAADAAGPGLALASPEQSRAPLPTIDAPPSPASTAPRTVTTVGPVLTPSAPVAITIPAIGVRSALQGLGLDADGALEVPAPGPRYDEAGWYRHSPFPGSLGPAVVVGHVDSAEDGPSVFFRLAELRAGDRVTIERADGSSAVFAVDDVERYPKASFPTDLVYGDTDHAALRLITCGGAIGEAGHYLDNVVVRASLVGGVAPGSRRT